MAKLRLCYDFDTWDAEPTVTASTEASSELGGENVLDEFVGRKWVTTSKANQSIVLDFGAAVEFTFFGLFTFNLTAAATVRLQAHTSNVWDDPAYTANLTVSAVGGVVQERIVHFLEAEYRYWRIFIDDPTNPSDNLSIGRAVAGDWIELSRNFSRDWAVEWLDKSVTARLMGDQAPMRLGKPFRRFRMRFNAFEQTMADQLTAMVQQIGNARPLAICLFPDSTDPNLDSAYGYWTTPWTLGRALITRYQTPMLTFEEVVD